MQSQHTLEDLKAQRKTVLAAMNLTGIPADELEIYQQTILRIEARITSLTKPTYNSQPRALSNKTQSGNNQQQKSHANFSIVADLSKNEDQNAIEYKSRTILAGGHAKTTDAITSSIEFANNSTQFIPIITITWSDGYKLTVDESDAKSRFKSTFRDTIALKCVSEQLYAKMWRWDTPWRAAGFYKAITEMRNGMAPSLKELGYTYPTEKQKEVFKIIISNLKEVQPES